MKIAFSEHAILQNKKRKISKIQILKTINNPDEIIESYRGKKIYRKKIRNKTLEVITIKEDNKIIIITQYFI